MPLPPKAPTLHAVPGDKFAALRLRSVSGEDLESVGGGPVEWVWDQIVPAGGTCLIGAGPGAGKTTLAFLLMAARAQTVVGEVLGRSVNPAPAGQYVVIVENEHSPRSAARRMLRAMRLQELKPPLPRTLIVCREPTFVGDPGWGLVESAVKDGLVSDIVLDTIASSTTEEANDEQAQILLFKRFKKIQLSSPHKLTLWILAHTRKAEPPYTMADISGSTQRTAQADVVLIATPNRDPESRRIKSVTIQFEKLREEPDGEIGGDGDSGTDPVRYKISSGKLFVLSGVAKMTIAERAEKIFKFLASNPELIHTVKSLSEGGYGRKALVEPALDLLVKAGRVQALEKDVRGNLCKVFFAG